MTTSTFVAYKTTKVQSWDRVDAYRLRKDKRLYWLQRLCVWALSRLGCHDLREMQSYRRVTIDFVNVADLIMQQAQAIRKMTGKWPKCVILGAAQADELELCAVGQLAFAMPPATGKFRGMLVIVAPYFDGVVCLEEVRDIMGVAIERRVGIAVLASVKDSLNHEQMIQNMHDARRGKVS